jgi:hypothetical protein
LHLEVAEPKLQRSAKRPRKIAPGKPINAFQDPELRAGGYAIGNLAYVGVNIVRVILR